MRSRSVLEILKPFEKLVVVYYQAEKFLASSRVFKHSCSFFKQFTSNYEILKVEVREVFPNIDFFLSPSCSCTVWAKI